MSKHITFVEQCLSGDAGLTDIIAFIEAWHEAEFDGSVVQWLGMTENEYMSWLEEPSVLRYIVRAHQKNITFEASFEDFALAARSSSPREAAKVRQWLEKTNRI